MYDSFKALVGEQNFTFVEEDDNPANRGGHAPFVPSAAAGVAEILKRG